MCHVGFETCTCNIGIIKRDKADPNQSKLGKRVLHELNIKQNLKQHEVT
jgi:hypothetical protein